MHDPARIEWLDGDTPFAPEYGDVYRPRDNTDQGHAVFVEACELDVSWSRGEPVHVLETGFGLGMNFTAALRALLTHGHPGASLEWSAIELHPASVDDVRRSRGADADDVDEALVAMLPELYAEGRAVLRTRGHEVRVRLVVGDGADALAHVDGPVDAVFLDGFAPDRNDALWSPEVFREVARIARPGARIATYTVARAVRDGLDAAGFDVERREGHGKKRHRLVGVRRDQRSTVTG